MLVDVAGGTVTPIDDALFPNPWNLSRITWTPDGSGFYFLYNERGHRVMRLLHVDAATGSVRTVVDERPATFFDYAHKLHLTFLHERGEAIWMSETLRVEPPVPDRSRDGARASARSRAASGSFARWITSTRRPGRSRSEHSARTRGRTRTTSTWGASISRAAARRGLTAGDGTHVLSWSPDRSHYVDTWSRVDLPPVHELRRASDGRIVATLAKADWTELRLAGWRPPERFVAKGRDGVTDIHGVIYTPASFDPNVSYPVIENIYAGPHGQFVPKAFGRWHGSREIAELGFIVVRIDGMGTNWRSKAFHDVAWKNLGDSGFPDRIAWMHEAASSRPWMDLDRVGIYGGSAGGQSALRGMLVHGDFYDAGRRRLRVSRQPDGQDLVERAVDGLAHRGALRRAVERHAGPPAAGRPAADRRRAGIATSTRPRRCRSSTR